MVTMNLCQMANVNCSSYQIQLLAYATLDVLMEITGVSLSKPQIDNKAAPLNIFIYLVAYVLPWGLGDVSQHFDPV